MLAGEQGSQGDTEEMEAAFGSMGSELRSWQFRPQEIPALAAKLDWNDLGRRVFIEPRTGLIALISPSSTHEGYARGTDSLTGGLSMAYGILRIGLGGTRWRRPGDPVNTGAEADASFYFGEKALALQQVPIAEWDAFAAAHPPDLVVELERIHGDEGKPAFYRELGVPEMWRLDFDKDRRLEVEILDLQAEGGPALLNASTVLPLCTPEFVQEALGLASVGRRAELDTLIAEAQAAEAARDAAADDPAPGL